MGTKKTYMTITIEFTSNSMHLDSVCHEDVATIFAVGHLIGIQHEDGTVNYINERLICTIHASAHKDEA